MGFPTTISTGLGVSPADIQAFDDLWMTAAQRQHDLWAAENHLSGEWDPGPWYIGGELMAAMVRMYDLTGGHHYVDHLHDLSRLALDYRDDGPKGSSLVDVFRGRVMPSWGEHGQSTGELHWCGIDFAGLYAYPIAAFARIVAENPDLQPAYGAEAVQMATSVVETIKAYVDAELEQRPNGRSTFVMPATVRTLLTPAVCEVAFEHAWDAIDRTAKPEDQTAAEDRVRRIRTNCNSLGKWAPRIAVPHNQAHALVMAMIEVWRALETPFVRDRTSQSALADWARGALLRIIKETYEFFSPELKRDSRGREWVSWLYSSQVPSGVEARREDAGHGGFSMRYIGVLHRTIDRINPVFFAGGQEPIDIGRLRRRLANTFVLKVGAGDHLAHNVDGTVKPSLAVDRYDDACNGWLDLAGADDRVYYRCRDIAQRVVVVVVDGKEQEVQPYLGVGTHASLLLNKPSLDRRLVHRSAEFRTPAATGGPTAWLIDPPGGHNIGYRDTSGRIHELWRNADGSSGTSNLTASANNAPKTVGDPSAYLDTAAGAQVVLYRTADGGVNSLFWSTGQTTHERLTPAGAPPAAGDPVGWFRPDDGVNHVAYRSSDGHIHVLWWAGANAARHEHLSGSFPPAVGNITGYRDPVRGDNLVFYRSADGHIRSLYWLHDIPRQDDLSGFAGTVPAAGGPTALYTSHDDTHQIVYRGTDGRIHELVSQGGNPVEGWVVSPAGVPAADGNPAMTYCAATNTKHVVYRSADSRLVVLSWEPGVGNPVRHLDLTEDTGAPAAADERLVAFTPEGSKTSHAVYRDDDGDIVEVRW